MIIAPGTTSQSVDIQIVDDSGLAVTGLVAATFPGVYWSIAGNTAATQITLADLAAITTAYSSGGVKERTGSAGVYRLDLPNAALASAGAIKIYGEASGKHLICEAIVVAYVPANVNQIAGQTANAAGAVTFPASVGTSTYAGADTSGTTTLLTRIPGAITLNGGNVAADVQTVKARAVTDPGVGGITLIGAGTGSNQLNVSGGRADANVLYWNGASVAVPVVPGYPLIDVGRWLGTACPAPNTAGYPLVDAARWGGAALPTAFGDTPGTTTLLARLPYAISFDGTHTYPLVSASNLPTDYQQRGVAVVLPSIPANWITAAGISAGALNGKGDWLLSSSYTAPPSVGQIDTQLSGTHGAGSWLSGGGGGSSISITDQDIQITDT